MVNRVMEQKALKLQRQIRRLPRQLPAVTPDLVIDGKVRPIPAAYSAEAVVAPRQPNRELMEGYKHRAASLGVDERDEDLLIKIFYGRNPFKGVTPARSEVEQHIERLRTFEADQLSFTILNTRVHRARVYFNSQRTVYLLLYENFKKNTVQSSLPHCSKIELIDKFRADCLQWVRIISSG